MARQIIVDIVGDASKFSKATDDATKKASGLQGILKTIGTGMGIGVGINAISSIGDAAQAVMGFAQDAVKAASDMNESVSKANVVFGPAIKLVDDFGSTSAKAFGISKQAAYESTATFGNLFKSMGIGQEAAADMSVNVVKLAADLASFNNVSIEETLAAIKSGLVGEAEPMRKYGVLLNEATVKSKAMAMGLADANGNISEQNKVLARNAIMFDQTASAQGDFSRTQGGLAAQQKMLNAQLADATAQIGEKLLPVVVKLVQAANDAIPVLLGLAEATDKVIWVAGLLSNPMGTATNEVYKMQEADAKAAEEKYKLAKAAEELLMSQRRAASGGADAMEQVAIAAQREADATEAAKAETIRYNETLKKTREWAIYASTELLKLAESFREAARSERESYEDQQTHIANLPNEIAISNARMLELKKQNLSDMTTAELAQHSIDLRNEQNHNNDLKREWETLPPYAKQIGVYIGNNLGSAMYSEVVKWNNLSRAQLQALGDIQVNPRYGGGPQRLAMGGPAKAGVPYIVGEHRPELFVPDTDGRVIPSVPSVPLTTGGGSVINMAFNVTSATDPEAFARSALLSLRRELSRQHMSLA